jgi:hypothetical protein
MSPYLPSTKNLESQELGIKWKKLTRIKWKKLVRELEKVRRMEESRSISGASPLFFFAALKLRS